MQRQPRHSPDFKPQVALEALQGREMPEQLAKRHGLPVALVCRWREELHRRSPRLFLSRRRRLAGILWLRSLRLRCLLATVLGVVLGRLLPAAVPWLAPLGVMGLQASQLVVMPYLVCEVLHSLGHLPVGSLGDLLRRAHLGLRLVEAEEEDDRRLTVDPQHPCYPMADCSPDKVSDDTGVGALLVDTDLTGA